MSRFIMLFCLSIQWFWLGGAYAVEATPAEIYAQVVRIEQEVDVLKRHFNVIDKPPVFDAKLGELKPRHVWSRCYVILIKLGYLRRKQGLSYVDPVGIEPQVEMPPNQAWGMTQRILAEINILKFNLDIPEQTPSVVAVSGKSYVDVYNKLNQISLALDQLGAVVSPSEVYGEVKRVNEDASAILSHLHIMDAAFPPPRRDNMLPKDSLHAVFQVLDEIQRIQSTYGLNTTDFKMFAVQSDKVTPDDVIGMVELSVVEMQRLKALQGMTHHITAPASYEQNKAPDDVVQLLGYIANKLRLIKPR